MTETLVFSVRAFDCTVRAAADCRETYAVLDRYIFPSLPRMDGDSFLPYLSIRLDRVAEEFQLSIDGQIVASEIQAVGLVPHLIHALDEAVVQRLTTLRAVHAGTVVWNGKALLLPGSTHSGKSSLVAELLRRSATYFSDEYALIDAGGLVHPYPRPLLLRTGSGDQYPMLASESNASTGDAPVQVGWILLLEYRAGGSWKIASVPQSLALMALLQNTPHALADSPTMVESFQRAVANAACYAGQRAEAQDAADEILRLIDAT